MRLLPAGLLAAALAAALTAGHAAATSEAEGTLGPIGGLRFTHLATASNTADDSTYLLHPLLVNRDDAVVLVTQVYAPKGGFNVFNDHPVGVYRPAKNPLWAIRNEDGATMPLNASFEVLVLDPGQNATAHTASKSNTAFNYTDLSPAFAPDVSTLRVFVTHRDPGVSEPHDHSIGIWKNDSLWSIFNEDENLMDVGHDFNVAIGPPDARTILHVADKTNLSENRTYLDHADLNNNPGAWLMVTHIWNPAVISAPELLGDGTYVNLAYGVWYDDKAGKWSIFDQAAKAGAIPDGAAFNVLIDPHPSLYIDGFENGPCFWTETVPGICV